MPTRTPLANLTTTALRHATALGLRTLTPTRARTTHARAAAGADADYGRPAEPHWTTIDWSEHVRDRTVRGRRVRYVELGDPAARPVVLVHGISSNWQNWLEQLARLAAEGYRAIALDLPGFGRSELPQEEEISMPGYGRLVDALCDELELGPVSLVGHSMGGFIAAEAAISIPERVERLVLVGAAGISHVDMRRAPLAVVGRLYPVLAARQLIQTRWVARRPLARHAVLSTIFRHPGRIRAELIFEIVSGAGSEGFPAAMLAIAAHDIRERLPEVGCPTLVLWGSDDLLAPVEDAQEYARLIPDVREVIMRDTGHMINSERPEAFNRLLLEFLAAPAGASVGDHRGEALTAGAQAPGDQR